MTSAKIPCTECGTVILPTTSSKNDGRCIPCFNGTRETIESSRDYYRKLREYNPLIELWRSIADRVYKTQTGLAGLHPDERLYFAVGIFDGEINNGGFDQFFWNSSGDMYQDVIDGLQRLNAFESLRLLEQAALIIFRNGKVPQDRQIRVEELRSSENEIMSNELDSLDQAYYAKSEDINEILTQFAEKTNLIQPFIKD